MSYDINLENENNNIEYVFSLEEKLDLLWSVCGELVREKEKYNIIKEITNEEIDKFCNGHDTKIKIDKNQLNDRIKRLEVLKSKLNGG